MGGDKGGQKGEGFSGTTIKDPWTKEEGVGNRGGVRCGITGKKGEGPS